MKCQENRQMIYTYLDGELSTHEERNLYSHMATCDSCQLDMDRARSIHHLLESTVKHVEPPHGFAERVMANLPSRTGTDKTDYSAFNFFKEESAAEEPIKQTKKKFKLNKLWVGIAAGLAFTFITVASFNQVAQIAIDPKAGDGYFVYITPKDKDQLIQEHKDNGQNSDDPKGQNLVVGDPDAKQDNETEDNPSVAPGDNMVADNTTPDSGAAQGDQNNEGKGSEGEKPTEKDEPSHVIASNLPTEREETFETREPIVIANATGTVTLTPLADNVDGATWNSTGSLPMYMMADNGGFQVYESQVNGEGKRSIGSYSTVGKWSPNKEYIVYTQTVNGKSTIWVEGRGDKKNLTPEEADAKGEGSKWAYNPVWSNKGEVAFLTGRFGGTEIMVVDMEGNSRRITNSGDRKEALTWSPDGTQIAYYKSWDDKGVKVGEIIVVSADGGNSISVTPTIKATNMSATWSPDGKLLAVNVAGEQQGVWVASSDGNSWERRLTTKGGGKTIKWSPDGQKIAFNDAAGVFHILVWRSSQASVNMIQISPMGGQMSNANIEWSKDSNEVLLEQPISGSNQKSIWIATLPKSMSAY